MLVRGAGAIVNFRGLRAGLNSGPFFPDTLSSHPDRGNKVVLQSGTSCWFWFPGVAGLIASSVAAGRGKSQAKDIWHRPRYDLGFLLSLILSALYFEVNTQQEVLGAAKK